MRLASIVPQLQDVQNGTVARAQSMARVCQAVEAMTASRRCAVPASPRITGRILSNTARTWHLFAPLGPLDKLVLAVVSIYSLYSKQQNLTLGLVSPYPSSDSQIFALGYGHNVAELVVQIDDGDIAVSPSQVLLELTGQLSASPDGGAAYISGISLVPLPLTPPWGSGELP
jgi:hypothetical protein